MKTYMFANLYKSQVPNAPSHVLVQLTQELLLRFKLAIRQTEDLRSRPNMLRFIEFDLDPSFHCLFHWFNASKDLESMARWTNLDGTIHQEDDPNADYAFVLSEQHLMTCLAIEDVKALPNNGFFLYPSFRVYSNGEIAICGEIGNSETDVLDNLETRESFYISTYA